MPKSRINHQVGTSASGLAAVKNDKGRWVGEKSGLPVKIAEYRRPTKK